MAATTGQPARPADPIPDRRGRYLHAARELFAHHGYERTTMDMVVDVVGGSKATLYKYFPSKDALLDGLMHEIAGRIDTFSPDIVNDAPLADALHVIGRAAMHGVLSPEAVTMLRLSLGQSTRRPEIARFVWERGPAVTYRKVRAFLDARAERGEVHFEDSQLAAEHFVAGLVGHLQPKIAMGIAEPPDDAEIERRVASAVEAFLHGHGNHP